VTNAEELIESTASTATSTHRATLGHAYRKIVRLCITAAANSASAKFTPANHGVPSSWTSYKHAGNGELARTRYVGMMRGIQVVGGYAKAGADAATIDDQIRAMLGDDQKVLSILRPPS